MARPVKNAIQDLEYQLARHKAVLGVFPSAIVNCHGGFQSKSVNQNYTNFEFELRQRGSKELYVLPYCEVEFTYEGKTEIIKVHTLPKAKRLVYVNWNIDLKGYVMRFSRLSINLKNNEFKEDMLNACRVQIMSFIKNNPGYKLDDKHLEPRLKKLLVFT